MSLPHVVVDNSAILPAYFPEKDRIEFDAGLVTNRSRALVHAIRMRRVNAYVPPSFFREFLNVATMPLYQPGGWKEDLIEQIRGQWEDLLLLPLIVVPTSEILHFSGILAFEERCPATDTWYVAAAANSKATFWMSHEHRDGLVTVAKRHARVRLLVDEAPDY